MSISCQPPHETPVSLSNDRGLVHMAAPICLISGVGPGTGTALARRFTEGGYRVALLARNEERLAALETELENAKAYRCDVSDPKQVEAIASGVERDLGSPSVLVHNAVGGTMGLLYLARRFAPAMVNAGKGAIAVTANTSALRSKSSFAGFAPTKTAQRTLAETMAKDLGPKGVHVSYVVIDAVIDVEWARKRFAGKPDEFFIKSRAIAEEVWNVVHQDRSAWSFSVEIRPFAEEQW